MEDGITGRKALLLRVGIDRGTGGALGPIFCDGTFEYVPIPEAEPTRSALTYGDLPGRHVPSLAAVLPRRLADRRPHLDPDFRTATYGDAAPRKRRQLLNLTPDDTLVFYAGLAPRPRDDRPRLFAIGTLHVARVHHLRPGDLARRDLQRKFGRTAHFLRMTDEDMALVEGEPRKSGLFARALPLGDACNCLLRDLAPLGYEGSLLRSVGHWIREASSLRSLDAWLRHGPASLVGPEARLVPIAASALRASRPDGDLAIEDRDAREGDWVLVLSERGAAGIRAFGRVNRTAPGESGERAMSSLFWSFPDGGPPLGSGPFRRLDLRQAAADGTAVRRLVSWFHRSYRIGAHHRDTDRPTSSPC